MIVGRTLLLLLAVSMTGIVDAEEYLLRVETVSYSDLPTDEFRDDRINRDDLEGGTVLNSIEVRVSPDGRFHGRATIGDESVMLTGELEPTPEHPGLFTISLQHSSYREDADDPGDSSHTRRAGTTVQTKTTTAVGECVAVAGTVTSQSVDGQPKQVTMTRVELELREFESPVEQEAQPPACPPSKSSKPISRLSMSTP